MTARQIQQQEAEKRLANPMVDGRAYHEDLGALPEKEGDGDNRGSNSDQDGADNDNPGADGQGDEDDQDEEEHRK